MLALGIVALAGCSLPPLQAPDGDAVTSVSFPTEAAADRDPDGTVVVAYPDEPSTFLAPQGQEVATDDLTALWGLPLLRLDPHGQLRRGLVQDWEVRPGEGDEPFIVRLELREGEWTDGTTVDAADVVATVDARRGGEPERFAPIASVAEVDADTVDVTFAQPYAAWADLLVELGTMLPSEAEGGGRGAFTDDVPVSGGWFRLVEREPGLRLRFDAHPDGPLGAPGVETVEVLFTPSFETSLGLLEDGEVDAVVGHLALNAVPRATELDGVRAEAPLGGTTVSLAFRPDGALGGPGLADRRRGVAETVDVGELVEGLLGPAGAVATTPWPEVDLPGERPVGEVREGLSLVLLVPGGSEVLGFTGRAVQRDLTSRGMSVDVVSEPAPRFAEVLGSERDVALVVRRTPPRPSLAPWVEDLGMATAAGADVGDGPDAAAALAAVAATSRTAPLFRVGVAHVWDEAVGGVRPSAWVGAGFWNAGEWTVASG